MNSWTLAEAVNTNRREELANVWISSPDDALEHLWHGPIGKATKILIHKLGEDSTLTPNQIRLREQLTTCLQQGLEKVGSLKLLIAAFIFIPPGKLRIKNPDQALPGWLLADYRAIYLNPPDKVENSASPSICSEREYEQTARTLQEYVVNRSNLNRLVGLSNLYYIDPTDQAILEELRDLRFLLARLIADANDISLGAAFSSAFGDCYLALLRSGIQNEPIHSSEHELQKSWMEAMSTGGSQNDITTINPNACLIAMSFILPENWESVIPMEKLPFWLKQKIKHFNLTHKAASPPNLQRQ